MTFVVMPEKDGLRFVLVRVEGYSKVKEVAIFPDRLELRSSGKSTAYKFVDIAAWPWPGPLMKVLAAMGAPSKDLAVGQREWLKSSDERYIRFYTKPEALVYLPEDPPGVDYNATLFRRIQNILETEGFLLLDKC